MKEKVIIVEGEFSETKKKFKKIHEYLIKVGIVDGSKDTLVQDLLDEDLSVDEVMSKILTAIEGLKTIHSKVEKLVYIAIAGFHRYGIVKEIRSDLRDQFDELTHALADGDLSVGYNLIKVTDVKPNDSDALKAIEMRLRAIKAVARLSGNHFLKRVYHVSKGWKIPLETVRTGK